MAGNTERRHKREAPRRQGERQLRRSLAPESLASLSNITLKAARLFDGSLVSNLSARSGVLLLGSREIRNLFYRNTESRLARVSLAERHRCIVLAVPSLQRALDVEIHEILALKAENLDKDNYMLYARLKSPDDVLGSERPAITQAIDGADDYRYVWDDRYTGAADRVTLGYLPALDGRSFADVYQSPARQLTEEFKGLPLQLQPPLPTLDTPA